ncbi:MAG: hypothetical protein MZU95_01590 [Desulfomicrobium escambiense]|nr:hypothetical protein [Desulfomicrobium escambiense]
MPVRSCSAAGDALGRGEGLRDRPPEEDPGRQRRGAAWLDFLETWNLAEPRRGPDRPESCPTTPLRSGPTPGSSVSGPLALEARQSALARAEAARRRPGPGRARPGPARTPRRSATADSSARCAAALEALGADPVLPGAHRERELFDPKEYRRLLRPPAVSLAMNRIEETRSLADGDGVDRRLPRA